MGPGGSAQSLPSTTSHVAAGITEKTQAARLPHGNSKARHCLPLLSYTDSHSYPPDIVSPPRHAEQSRQCLLSRLPHAVISQSQQVPCGGRMHHSACHSNLSPPYLGMVIQIKQRLETVVVSKQICGIQILCSSIVLSCAGSLFLKSELGKINYSRPECEKVFFHTGILTLSDNETQVISLSFSCSK